MNCTDLEILLCDYVDGTLRGEEKALVETHLAECPACAALARDAGSALAFMGRAAEVEPPAELLTRILFELPSAKQAKSAGFWSRLKVKWIEPVLQPRFAMGMAMTVLSFAMLGRFAGIEIRQLKPSDLEPAKVWMTVEDRAMRTWDRAVKYYQSLRLVYDVQTRLSEMSEQADTQTKADSAKKSKDSGQSGQGARSQGEEK
jgi:Putative zinc-finger